MGEKLKIQYTYSLKKVYKRISLGAMGSSIMDV